MNSPLSSIVTDLFMHEIEQEALQSSPQKPSLCFRYGDDIFTILPYDKTVKHISLSHKQRTATTIYYRKRGRKLTTLSWYSCEKREDGCLRYIIYQKTIHTHCYLQVNSHHHPAHLNSVINTLVHSSLLLTDQWHTRHKK